jgi:ABC-type glycerol-3-phosphate transport system substrate-binding protein
MKKIVILALLATSLLAACGGAETMDQDAADTGLPVTVYYSPT